MQYRIPDVNARFRRNHANGQATLSWPYRNSIGPAIFLVFWLLFWWIFLFLVFPLMHPSIFTIIAIIVVLVASYILLVQLINRTKLRIDQNVIKVSHGPLPCSSSTRINTADVSSFSKHEYTKRGRKGRIREFYAVVATLLNGDQVELVTRINWYAQHEVEYLVQELNEFLNIKQIN